VLAVGSYGGLFTEELNIRFRTMGYQLFHCDRLMVNALNIFILWLNAKHLKATIKRVAISPF
jgi:hypothetical protein